MQIDGVTDLFFSYGTFWILQELSWDSPTTKIDEEKQLISFFFLPSLWILNQLTMYYVIN